MDLVSAIVLLSPCVLVVLLMLFVLALRYISYRERVALAAHGYPLDEPSLLDRWARRSPRGVLWAGVITTMSGLALLLGLLTIGVGWWLLGGLLPLFVGLGMIFLYFTGGKDREQAGQPAPEEGDAEAS